METTSFFILYQERRGLYEEIVNFGAVIKGNGTNFSSSRNNILLLHIIVIFYGTQIVIQGLIVLGNPFDLGRNEGGKI